MASYRFLTVWVLDAPIEKVWAVITDNQKPPYLVEGHETGEASGIRKC